MTWIIWICWLRKEIAATIRCFPIGPWFLFAADSWPWLFPCSAACGGAGSISHRGVCVVAGCSWEVGCRRSRAANGSKGDREWHSKWSTVVEGIWSVGYSCILFMELVKQSIFRIKLLQIYLYRYYWFF